MVAYTKPQKWKKEESEGLRGREIRTSLLSRVEVLQLDVTTPRDSFAWNHRELV